MRVQIGEQEGEERELGDVPRNIWRANDFLGHPECQGRRVEIVQRRDHSAASPEVEVGEILAADKLHPCPLGDLDYAVQITDNRNE